MLSGKNILEAWFEFERFDNNQLWMINDRYI